MRLSVENITGLKTAILADQTASGYLAAGDMYSLLAWLNAPSTTTAWRVSMPGADVYAAHKPVEYIARSAAERSAFDLMCTQTIDPSQAKFRNAVVDIFSGPTNSTSRALILQAMTEPASNAEAILGGTSATTDTVTALKRSVPGAITMDECNRIPTA